jgi:hypothetical protein
VNDSVDPLERLTKGTNAANANTGTNLETYTLDAEGNRIASHRTQTIMIAIYRRFTGLLR